MKRLDAARARLRKAEQGERTVARLLAEVDIGDEILGFHCQMKQSGWVPK